MTLAIAVTNPEGIVMAAESRQTYQGRKGARIGSDSATKIFELADTILAMTAGWAFLRPNDSPTLRNISSLVEEFKSTIKPNSGVEAVAKDLHTYFLKAYTEHTTREGSLDKPVPSGQFALQFLVGGYDLKSRVGIVFQCFVPGTMSRVMDTSNPGANWIGQSHVVARLFKGWDEKMLSLPLLSPLVQQHGPAFIQQLAGLQYVINWHTITLQDAIDLSKAMIQITISVQRFTDGLAMDPGDVPGVGGEIDIAVVRPEGKVTWIQKKELHA